MTTEDRLIEIETKLLRQEDLVEVLNRVLYEQQKQLDRLEASLSALARRVIESQEPPDAPNALNDRPPHY